MSNPNVHPEDGTRQNDNLILCRLQTYTAIKKSVTAGTELAIRDCKKIFAHETWNCHVELVKSQVFFRSVLPGESKFRAMPQRGGRQTGVSTVLIKG